MKGNDIAEQGWRKYNTNLLIRALEWYVQNDIAFHFTPWEQPYRYE